MKLEEGMYVRFNYHRVTVPIQIAKIKEKYYDEMEKYYYYLTDNGLIISEENIIKTSENIIDLIQSGDYVNGGYVLDFETLQTGEKTVIVDGLINYGWGQGVIPVSEIKSIVTKEQFESTKYEVKENE